MLGVILWWILPTLLMIQAGYPSRGKGSDSRPLNNSTYLRETGGFEPIKRERDLKIQARLSPFAGN